jgi:uroporphyrinogen-III synthase
MRTPSARLPLSGHAVVVTRPAGAGAALLRAVRARGGRALSLPGSSLRGPPDPRAAAAALARARRVEAVVFTSPAAVRFAFALAPAWKPARGTRVYAVGPATARALRRRAVAATAPDGRYDSEGVLAALASTAPRDAAVVGAPGGRGLIADGLRARGVPVAQVEVYRRLPARIDARHLAPLVASRGRLLLLLSSVETLDNLRGALPEAAWSRLAAGAVVASGPRVAEAARRAGLRVAAIAASALARDLLDAATALARR